MTCVTFTSWLMVWMKLRMEFSQTLLRQRVCLQPLLLTKSSKISLRGVFQKNAKKIITSRPDAYLSLHPKCKSDFTVQFLGLSKKSQIELSKTYLQKQWRNVHKSARKIGNEPRSCCFLLHSLVLQSSCRAVKKSRQKDHH